MKKLKITLFLSLFLLLSCQKSTIYQKTKNHFENNRWYQSEILNHVIEIKEKGNYSFFLEVRHIYGFQFDEIPLLIKIQQADGTPTTIQTSIQIKDKKGKDMGDCIGDICDLEQIVIEKEPLTKGKYTVSIAPNFKYDYIPNILAIGLHLKKYN